MRYGLFVFLLLTFLPGQTGAQETVLTPSSSRVIQDTGGRGTALVEFNICGATLDGLVINALLEWEPENIDEAESSEYQAHIVEPGTTVEAGEEAWELLRNAPTSRWDINPSESEREAAKRIRLILPTLAKTAREGNRCRVMVLIGSHSVIEDDLSLETVKLKLHTVPGVK